MTLAQIMSLVDVANKAKKSGAGTPEPQAAAPQGGGASGLAMLASMRPG